MTAAFTRAQYIATNGTDEERRAAHRRYYAQYVNDETRADVARSIGMDALLKSTDRALNDIPLQRWDALCGFSENSRTGEIVQYATGSFPCNRIAEELGTWMSPSDLTCIAKEAARQLIEAANA